MIVLDASVLIAFLDGSDNHHLAAEQVLTNAVDDDLAVNPLTLAEVLVAPVRNGQVDGVLAALRALEIQELPFPADTALRLAQLRATTGLKMPDCCVFSLPRMRLRASRPSTSDSPRRPRCGTCLSCQAEQPGFRLAPT